MLNGPSLCSLAGTVAGLAPTPPRAHVPSLETSQRATPGRPLSPEASMRDLSGIYRPVRPMRGGTLLERDNFDKFHQN